VVWSLKKPHRKTKCKVCGTYFFKRTHPGTREKIIVTEKGAKEISDLWQSRFFVEKHMKNLYSFDNYDEIFEDEKIQLEKRFNCIPLDGDVVWSLYIKRKQEYGKSFDF